MFARGILKTTTLRESDKSVDGVGLDVFKLVVYLLSNAHSPKTVMCCYLSTSLYFSIVISYLFSVVLMSLQRLWFRCQLRIPIRHFLHSMILECAGKLLCWQILLKIQIITKGLKFWKINNNTTILNLKGLIWREKTKTNKTGKGSWIGLAKKFGSGFSVWCLQKNPDEILANPIEYHSFVTN